MHMPEHMLRSQTTVTVGTTSTQIAGPNPRRKGLVIGCPPIQPDPGSASTKLASSASTATTGVKLSFTVPAGQQATLTGAGVVETTGTGVISNLQVVRAATTFNLGTVTTTGTILATVPLQAGDVVQWNVTTAIAASVSDFWLGLTIDVGTTRLTVSLSDVAVLDNGFNLYPGTLPFTMWHHEYGDALHEAISAITQAGSLSVTVVDFFG